MRIGSISSTSNNIVKQTAALLQSKGRREQGRFLVEGLNAISNLPPSLNVRYVLYEENKGFEPFVSAFNSYSVSRAVIDKVSDTVSCQGIVAVVDIPPRLDLPSSALGNLVVLDNVMDSGNVGAIVRCCAAFGFENVLMIGGADPFSPKCVRASMGGIFFVNVFDVSVHQVLALKERGYQLISADMKGEDYSLFVPPSCYALVIGSEAHGVCNDIMQGSRRVSIPISNVESLNAAVAAGIILSKFSTFK